MSQPKEIRRAAGLSLIQAAVGARRAQNTVMLYEANRAAVSEPVRRDLDRYYAELAAATEERQSA